MFLDAGRMVTKIRYLADQGDDCTLEIDDKPHYCSVRDKGDGDVVYIASPSLAVNSDGIGNSFSVRQDSPDTAAEIHLISLVPGVRVLPEKYERLAQMVTKEMWRKLMADLHPKGFDEQLRSELLWDFMIVDWLIYDGKGKPIQCTKENKVKLMMGSVDFAVFVGECIERLTDGERKRAEDQEKNLGNTSSE